MDVHQKTSFKPSPGSITHVKQILKELTSVSEELGKLLSKWQQVNGTKKLSVTMEAKKYKTIVMSKILITSRLPNLKRSILEYQKKPTKEGLKDIDGRWNELQKEIAYTLKKFSEIKEGDDPLDALIEASDISQELSSDDSIEVTDEESDSEESVDTDIGEEINLKEVMKEKIRKLDKKKAFHEFSIRKQSSDKPKNDNVYNKRDISSSALSAKISDAISLLEKDQIKTETGKVKTSISGNSLLNRDLDQKLRTPSASTASKHIGNLEDLTNHHGRAMSFLSFLDQEMEMEVDKGKSGTNVDNDLSYQPSYSTMANVTNYINKNRSEKAHKSSTHKKRRKHVLEDSSLLTKLKELNNQPTMGNANKTGVSVRINKTYKS